MRTATIGRRKPRPNSISNIARSGLLFIALAGIAAPSGCSSGPPMATIDEGAYSGPPLAIDSTGPQHRAVLTAPTGGWAATLDQTRARFDHVDIFMTITRPDPAYMQTQALVKHEIGAMVGSKTAIELYARVLDFGERPRSQAYQFAGHAPGQRPAPPPGPAPANR